MVIERRMTRAKKNMENLSYSRYRHLGGRLRNYSGDFAMGREFNRRRTFFG
jgi:hypothetical protein